MRKNIKQPHVVSVQHTGSCFMVKLLDCKLAHTSHPLWRLKAIARDHVIVTPLRDPRAVWESWLTRNNKTSKYFMQQWNTLKHFDSRCHIFYVPIDRPERDECIQELSEELDRELKPDWDTYIRCAHEHPSLPYDATIVLTDETWEYLYGLPLIKRFYNG